MSKTAMIPEDIQKKIEESADRYAILKSNPFGGKIYLPQLNTGFSDGAEFGYSLSQSKIQELEKENERWRGLVEKTFFTSIHAIHRTKQAWQQFKEQNNL